MLGMSGGDGSLGWRRGHEVSPGHGAESSKLGELVANELWGRGGKAAANGAWERQGEIGARINGLEGEGGGGRNNKETRDKKTQELGEKEKGGERGGEKK